MNMTKCDPRGVLALLALLAGCGPAGNDNNNMNHNGNGNDPCQGVRVDRVAHQVYSPAAVRVVFRVLDCDGYPVRPLTGQDLTVINDETGQPFGAGGEGGGVSEPAVPSNFKLYSVLALDMSDSIFNAGALDDVVDGAKTFVQQLVVESTGDQRHYVAIMVFGRTDAIQVVLDFTDDPVALNAKLEELRGGVSLGTTNLYGAYMQALEVVQAAGTGADLAERSVVILTDGTHEAGDEDAMRAQALAARDSAEASGAVSVFCIGIQGAYDEQKLRELATKDDYFVLAADVSALITIFDDVASRLAEISYSNYVVGVCTPVELGSPTMTINVNVDGAADSAVVAYSTATLTGDVASCDAAQVAAPCRNRECGEGYFQGVDCGICEGVGAYCSDEYQCVNPTFNVVGATAPTATQVTVEFDAPPNQAQAATLANYNVAGLALTGVPVVVGNTVTITTSAQQAVNYTIEVVGVTRAGDSMALTDNTANFSGSTSFNVVAVTATTPTQVVVEFDAPPNQGQATTLANYSVPGLTLNGVPALQGNTVTITTSAQAEVSYTMTVANVTRASDADPLVTDSVVFMNGIEFNVVSAESTGNTHLTVTFSALPHSGQATTLTNYSIPGLTLSGVATLASRTVTFNTSAQSTGQYTVTVSNVTRFSDGQAMTNMTTTFEGSGTFNVVSAVATDNTTVRVTFDAPPFASVDPADYDIPGLTISGVFVNGNDVVLVTSPQSAIVYTVTANVTRALDGLPLTIDSAMFTGVASFNVVSAVSTGAYLFTVTFSAPPGAIQANNVNNYSVPGLTLSAVDSLVGNTVTIRTMWAQSAVVYTVTVSGNVQRASDGESLTTATATFTGRTEFSVVSAATTGHFQCTITFSHAPNAAQAAVLANYTINQGLVLSGVPVLNGNTVTITTSAQAVVLYSIQAFNVTRASDGEPLTAHLASFTGTP